MFKKIQNTIALVLLLGGLAFAAGSPRILTTTQLINFLQTQEGVKVRFSGPSSPHCFAIVETTKPLREITNLSNTQLEFLGVVNYFSNGDGIVYNITVPKDFCNPPGKSATEGQTTNVPQPSIDASQTRLPNLWPVAGLGLVMIFILFGWQKTDQTTA